MRLTETEAGVLVKKPARNWATTEGDRAYLSHHHTIEAVETLGLDWGFVETRPFHSVNHQEYRNTFISMTNSQEFCITTIVYVDSSTYTCLHAETEESVFSLPQERVVRLSNADIKRPEGRKKREQEIAEALTILGFIEKPEAKKTKVHDGLAVTKGDDGLYTIDYSGFRSGKIETVERVIDYREINKVRPDDKKPK